MFPIFLSSTVMIAIIHSKPILEALKCFFHHQFESYKRKFSLVERMCIYENIKTLIFLINAKTLIINDSIILCVYERVKTDTISCVLKQSVCFNLV